MISSAYSGYKTRQTPQSSPADPRQVENSAGGYTFALDDFARLRRFLILGSDAPTYYATAHKLTVENAECVVRCAVADPKRTVDEIVTVSGGGLAPKNDPAIFALTLAASSVNPEARQRALEALPVVCRTGTHLFTFLELLKGNRGWGRGLKRAVGRWYLDKGPNQLALQVVKYRQRGGWTHRDALRKAKPKGFDPRQEQAVRFATGKPLGTLTGAIISDENIPKMVRGFVLAQAFTKPVDWVRCITDYGLPWEALPDAALKHPEVWDALRPHMGLTALLRNLGRMTSIGCKIDEASLMRLNDIDEMRRARVHPLQVLVGMNTYGAGHGEKGKLTWAPDRRVVDALDGAFYASFGAIEPTGKRTMLALDVSGSMGGPFLSGMPGISPRVGSAAMAMATARSEKDWECMAFSSGFIPLSISPRQRLDDICRMTSQLPFDGTDCSVPMLHALKTRTPIDTFVIYTDNETWSGRVHPHQALRDYREKMGIDARLVVVGMTSTGFSIADPSDRGMLDVAGFDVSAPNVISDFARGSLG